MRAQRLFIEQTKLIRNTHPNWIYTGLYGSQNYNCDWARSDVDTKSIVGLSFSELVQRKDINKTHKTDGTTENLADVKDVHSMFHNFKKSNINFLEILCTDFIGYKECVEKEIMKLRSMVDQCAYYNVPQLIHATVGQFRMKAHALEKPFESKLPLIELYGYDPKQLASAVRLGWTTENLIQFMPFKKAIDLTRYRDIIIGLKANPVSLEEARDIIARWTAFMDEQLEKVKDFSEELYPDPADELQTLEEDIYKKLFSIR